MTIFNLIHIHRATQKLQEFDVKALVARITKINCMGWGKTTTLVWGKKYLNLSCELCLKYNDNLYYISCVCAHYMVGRKRMKFNLTLRDFRGRIKLTCLNSRRVQRHNPTKKPMREFSCFSTTPKMDKYHPQLGGWGLKMRATVSWNLCNTTPTFGGDFSS